MITITVEELKALQQQYIHLQYNEIYQYVNDCIKNNQRITFRKVHNYYISQDDMLKIGIYTFCKIYFNYRKVSYRIYYIGKKNPIELVYVNASVLEVTENVAINKIQNYDKFTELILYNCAPDIYLIACNILKLTISPVCIPCKRYFPNVYWVRYSDSHRYSIQNIVNVNNILIVHIDFTSGLCADEYLDMFPNAKILYANNCPDHIRYNNVWITQKEYLRIIGLPDLLDNCNTMEAQNDILLKTLIPNRRTKSARNI